MTGKIPSEGDLVELIADLDAYGLAKGDVGKILVAYDPYQMDVDSDFEVFFEKIDTSVLLLQEQFKLR